MPTLLDEAAIHYRQALDMGEDITDAQLGQRYDRSARWGRRAIAEAKKMAAPVTTDVQDGQPPSNVGHEDDQPAKPDAPDDQPMATDVQAPDQAASEVAKSAEPARGDGRAWARLALALGAGLSVAGNVYSGMSNGAVSATSAAIWPVLLFVAIEVIVRVSWPDGFWPAVARWVGALSVAAVAAMASYVHLYAVLLATDGHVAIAIGGPVAIDGLMLVATAALMAKRK